MFSFIAQLKVPEIRKGFNRDKNKFCVWLAD